MPTLILCGLVMDIIEKEEFLNKEHFIAALPKSARMRVTDEMVDSINNLICDPQLRENFRDNLISYSSVLHSGKFKLQNYIDAVRFVSYKLTGSTAIEAYAKTFPERYQRLVDEGADNKTISAYSAAYNKTVLVNKIFEQTLVPTYILNADLAQKAINILAQEMVAAKSERTRVEAADKLLGHLKRPEATKIELDIGLKEDKSIDELRNSTMELVSMQRKMLESGMLNAKEVAHSKVVTGEVVDD